MNIIVIIRHVGYQIERGSSLSKESQRRYEIGAKQQLTDDVGERPPRVNHDQHVSAILFAKVRCERNRTRRAITDAGCLSGRESRILGSDWANRQ